MQKGGETAHQVIGLKVFPILHTANPHRHGATNKAQNNSCQKLQTLIDQVNRVAEWGMKERAGAERRRNGPHTNWCKSFLILRARTHFLKLNRHGLHANPHQHGSQTRPTTTAAKSC